MSKGNRYLSQMGIGAMGKGEGRVDEGCWWCPALRGRASEWRPAGGGGAGKSRRWREGVQAEATARARSSKYLTAHLVSWGGIQSYLFIHINVNVDRKEEGA